MFKVRIPVRPAAASWVQQMYFMFPVVGMCLVFYVFLFFLPAVYIPQSLKNTNWMFSMHTVCCALSLSLSLFPLPFGSECFKLLKSGQNRTQKQQHKSTAFCSDCSGLSLPQTVVRALSAPGQAQLSERKKNKTHTKQTKETTKTKQQFAAHSPHLNPKKHLQCSKKVVLRIILFLFFV